MSRHPTMFDFWMLGLRTTRMLMEAQTVIAFRMMGLGGIWPVAPSETSRMVSEKGPAFLRSGGAAMVATMKGRRPDQVAQAALRPIGVKTRSNAKRLSKRRTR